MLHQLYEFQLIPVHRVYAGSESVGQYFPKWFIDEVNRLSDMDSRLYALAQKRFDQKAMELLGRSAETYSKWERYRVATNEVIERS